MPKKKAKKTRRIKRVKKTKFPLNKYLLILLVVLLFFLLLVALNPKKTLIFKGTIPCADCPGIEETITLNPNNTYLYKDVYLERDVTYVEEGQWIIVKDRDKNRIIYELSLQNNKEKKRYYMLEGNKMSPLDGDLNPLPPSYNNASLIKQ